MGSYWLAVPSPQLHCCQTLSHAYEWWKLGWGLANLLCTYWLVLLEGCLGPLAWFITKAGERGCGRGCECMSEWRGLQRATRTMAWCMLGNRHAFTFLISWTSFYISTAAILQLIRIFGWWPAQGNTAFPQAWREQSHLKRLSVHSHWYHSPVNLKQRPLSLKEKKKRKKKKKRKRKKQGKKEKKEKRLNLFIEIPKATFYLFYIFIYYIEFIFNEICTGQIGILEALGSVGIKWQSLLWTCGNFMQVGIREILMALMY